MRAITDIERKLILDLTSKGFSVTELALYAKDFLLREAEQGNEFAKYQYDQIKETFRKIYYGMN